MIAVVFDTETTGLIESPLARLEFQPHVIQFCAAVADLDTGGVERWYETLVRPPRLELVTDKISKLTRITQEQLATAPRFADVFDEIFEVLGSCSTAVAHNLTFDRDVLDIEALRLGSSIVWPARLICTVEQSVHLMGHNADLTTLHEKLLGCRFEGAHSARSDVEALVRVATEMRRRVMI